MGQFQRNSLYVAKESQPLAMSTEGILDCYIVTGSVDAEKFVDFVQQALLPHLLPFDGVNPCRFDNASIHHVDGVVDLIESTGALVVFLPPLDPIEEAFSKLKSTLKPIKNY